MTVASTTNRWAYDLDGVEDTYDYTTKIFESSDLLVQVYNSTDGTTTTLTETTDYSVTGAGEDDGGTVVLVDPSAYTTDDDLIIKIVLPLTQETDLTENNPFLAETLEEVFDRATRIAQQLQEQLDRVLLRDISQTSQLTLPIASAGKLLGWNDDEDAIVNLDASGLPTGTLGQLLVHDGTSWDAETAPDLNLGDIVSSTLEINNDGTGHGIYLHQDGVLANGYYGLYVTSSVNQTGSAYGLVKFQSTNASSVQPVLVIDNDGAGKSIYIDQSGSGICAEINNDGTNHGLYIHQDGVNAVGDYGLWVATSTDQVNSALASFYTNASGMTTPVVLITHDHASTVADALEIDNDGTGKALYIHQDGVLGASNYGLYVYSNVAQVTSPLVSIVLDHASSSQYALNVQNDGTGDNIHVSATGTGNGLLIQYDTNVLAGGKHGLYVYTNAVNTNADSALVYIHQDSTSASEPCLELNHDGKGAALEISVTANDSFHLLLTGDPTVSTPVDGALWWTGTNLNFYTGADTVDLLTASNAFSTEALSSDASVSLTLIAGEKYEVVIMYNNGSDHYPYLRFNSDSGNNYSYANQGASFAGAGQAGAEGTNLIAMTNPSAVNDATKDCLYRFYIIPKTGDATKVFVNGDGNSLDTSARQRVEHFAGQYDGGSDVTSVQILVSAGNMTGTVYYRRLP